MDRRDERRARRGPVLGEQPSGLITHPARVAKRLGSHGPGPPLRGLLYLAMQALAHWLGLLSAFLIQCKTRLGLLGLLLDLNWDVLEQLDLLEFNW
ncbi:hypothetical protein QJS10_CPA09g02077 [Acorus calamus]|uniref:Uncharacterized protein n=1 Tax=Acorus calamus TaxID=4465 RepID=A0AAV9E2U9_ACOCL|nr:hypothetical protein QJS10_CPA09g02077 [Acorus calamus]